MRVSEIKTALTKMLGEELNVDEIQRLSQEKPFEETMIRQWEHAPSYHQTDHINPLDMWQMIKEKQLIPKNQFRRKMRIAYTVAASVAILLLSVWLVNYLFVDHTTVLLGQANNKVAYILPDSSRVWIKEGSSVTYSKRFLKERTIKLKGEALFSVRKRYNAPFTVYTDRTAVLVKGTEFNVKAAYQETEVTLFSGKIAFNVLSDASKTIEMNPNEQVVYNSTTGVLLKKCVDTMEYDWRLNEFVFTRKTLKELTAFLHRLHGVTITFADESEAGSLFTGVIRSSETLSETLDKICISFNLSYRKEGGCIVIY